MAVIDGHFIWVGSCIILQKRLYGRYNKCMNIKGMLISIIVLEIWGITAVKRKKLMKSMIYYTQLSNVAGMFSALFLLVFGSIEWVIGLRFLSVCMLTMTGFVTIFILRPMLKNNRALFWSRSGFFLHIVCPLLNLISYFFLEEHAEGITLCLPAAVTLLYGIIMIYMNYIGKVDGPYPFLRVREQSKKATVIWIILLLILIGFISTVIYWSSAMIK